MITPILLASLILSLSQIQAKFEEVKAQVIEEKTIRFNELDPLLQKIALCESHARQSARGPLGEIGIFQVRPEVWNKKAKEMGLDIYHANENMEFGVWLFETHGTRPWLASKKCWSK